MGLIQCSGILMKGEVRKKRAPSEEESREQRKAST